MIKGGGSGEELMQQTNQLLSRIRRQIHDQSAIYAKEGDLTSHRQGRDALKHLDAGDVRMDEGRRPAPEGDPGGASAGLDPVPPEQAGQAGRPAPTETLRELSGPRA